MRNDFAFPYMDDLRTSHFPRRTMTLPAYLTARAGYDAKVDPSFFGDAGYSLASFQRPSYPLEVWMAGDDVPVHAKDVLSSEPAFASPEGLVRISLDPESADGTNAGWILARVASGLISIVVRDAWNTKAGQVLSDMDLAIRQAKRFRAEHAVLLLQAGTRANHVASQLLVHGAFGNPAAEVDRLYLTHRDDLPAWYGILSLP